MKMFKTPGTWALIFLGCSLSGTPIATAQNACAKPEGIANPHPWTAGNAIVFITNGLAVDADGAPDSYLIDGNGLSFTCDGVAAIVNGKRVSKKTNPANWQDLCKQAWAHAVSSGDFSSVAIFGMLTDKQNRPLVQQAGDPLPGKAYITTTSMTVPGTPDGTQRHWVDATAVPYIVLTSSFIRSNQIRTGDLAVVFRPKTNMIAFAVYAGYWRRLGRGVNKITSRSWPRAGHETAIRTQSQDRNRRSRRYIGISADKRTRRVGFRCVGSEDYDGR